MSFHLSAEDIRIEDNHILKARLRNENGDWVDAEIDLNQHLGNQDGEFTSDDSWRLRPSMLTLLRHDPLGWPRYVASTTDTITSKPNPSTNLRRTSTMTTILTYCRLLPLC